MQPVQDPEVERLLRDSGWYPGRRVAEAVERWRASLTDDGFIMHPVAETILLEYGGLHVGGVGPGINLARSDVQFDPTLAFGERDRFTEYFAELRDQDVFPLGEAHLGHGFVGVSRSGQIFLLMDAVYARWTTFGVALRGLLLGIR